MTRPKKRKKKGRKVSRPTKRQRERQERKRQKKRDQEALDRMLARMPLYIGSCADCRGLILSNSDFTFKRKDGRIVGMYHFYCGPKGRIMKQWRDESREWNYIRDEMLTDKRKWNDSGRRWPANARPRPL